MWQSVTHIQSLRDRKRSTQSASEIDNKKMCNIYLVVQKVTISHMVAGTRTILDVVPQFRVQHPRVRLGPVASVDHGALASRLHWSPRATCTDCSLDECLEMLSAVSMASARALPHTRDAPNGPYSCIMIRYVSKAPFLPIYGPTINSNGKLIVYTLISQ